MAAASTNTFSLFFPPVPAKAAAAGQQWPPTEQAASYEDLSSTVTSPSSPSSDDSSAGSLLVDCTLSLGTPSSRAHRAAEPVSAAAESCYHYYQQQQQSMPAAGTGIGIGMGGVWHEQQQLEEERRCCANCGTSSTPLWRNGPRGPKSLCNACGIRFKKEERRAAETNGAGAGGCGLLSPSHGAQRMIRAPRAAPEAPFLEWRLNAVPTSPAVWPERASLYQQ